MTVADSSAFNGPFIANGSTKNFPFTFRALGASEVKVFSRGDDGVDIEVNSSLYSVTIGLSGGSVNFYTAPTSGQKIVIASAPKMSQEIGFQNNSAWLAEPHNEGLDRSAIRDQALARDVKRAWLSPLGEVGLMLPSREALANSALVFDADGNPMAGPPLADMESIAESIENIKIVADNIDSILGNYENIDVINTVYSNLDVLTDVSGFSIRFDDIEDQLSQKGLPDGYAGLDGSGKVPASQLPDFMLKSGGTFTGPIGVTGNMLATGEVKALSGADGEVHLKANSIEIGRFNREAAGTAFLDFHSSINSPDYDTRIAATGGTSDVGRGALTYTALGGHSFLGAITTTGGVTINNSSSSTLLFSRGGVGKWLFGNASNDVFYLNKGAKTLFLIDPEGPEAVGTPEIRTYVGSFAEVHSLGHAKTGSMRIIGYSGIAFNDNTANIQSVYGIYGEAVRDPNTGAAQASEFNGANGGNVVDIDPYSALGSITTSTWLSAGLTTRPDHNNPLSAAGVMINNGGTFRRGWVLRDGALDPAGPMDFMAVPKDTRLSWYAATNVRTDQLMSTSTSAAGATTLVFGQNSVNFYNSSSGKAFLSVVNTSAASVNFAQFRSSPAGSPVIIEAAGDSANIDLKLTAKGLGKVMLGAYATSGDTPVVGYMVVKDASGNERKLAVIA